MALKGQYTTAEALKWEEMINLVHRLFRDGDYRMSLLIATQCMWGLRIGDELKLTWNDILHKDDIVITEQKTGKRRTIRVNKDLKKHIEDCYKALGSPVQNEPIFLSRLGTIYSREWVNMRLKEFKVKYRLSIKSYSSHSHRKTFGRHIVERAGADAEKALIKLSEIFSHSSCEITRRYLGLKAEEIGEVYESLDF